MKKIAGMLAIVCMMAIWMVQAFGSGSIRVRLGSQEIAFDQAPVLEGGRVWVPMRQIFESLDAKVTWHGEQKTVTAIKNDTKIQLQLHSKTAFINDKKINLESMPRLKHGRIFVPLRFISESLGAKVTWDGNNRLVMIQEKVQTPVTSDHGMMYKGQKYYPYAASLSELETYRRIMGYSNGLAPDGMLYFNDMLFAPDSWMSEDYNAYVDDLAEIFIRQFAK